MKTTASAKTIRDYLEPPVGRRAASREGPGAGRSAEAARSFRDWLRSGGPGEERSAPAALSVQDYLRSPLWRPAGGGGAASRGAVSAPDGASVARPAGRPPTPSQAEGPGREALPGGVPRPAAGKTAPGRDDTAERIERAIQAAAARHGIAPDLLRAVVRAESNFDPRAVSVKGAMGLMQLMPETARELGVSRPFDIQQNVEGGARYLRQMLDRFGGDLRRALAAYNAGPAAVERCEGEVPFAETRDYVRRVLRVAGLG
ncbi:MAG: lytic transglycosylase domain-containing protein [Desulfobacterales bacterium]